MIFPFGEIIVKYFTIPKIHEKVYITLVNKQYGGI
jgi:hypothetical protein